MERIFVVSAGELLPDGRTRHAAIKLTVDAATFEIVKAEPFNEGVIEGE